jgi:hypothetical protein
MPQASLPSVAVTPAGDDVLVDERMLSPQVVHRRIPWESGVAPLSLHRPDVGE